MAMAITILIVFVACIWAIVRIQIETGRRREQNLRVFVGACVKCGYNLHASVDRCPECGTPITGDSLPNLTAWHRLRLRPDICDSVKAAVAASRAEAVRLQHNYLGTEHLLLGILQVAQTIEPVLYAEIGVCTGEARDWVESVASLGRTPVQESMLVATPAANRVLSRAFEFRRTEGTQAILLRQFAEALLCERDCTTAHLFSEVDGAEPSPDASSSRPS